MSEKTTGRKMLADLDKRVGALEGNGKPEPWEKLQEEIRVIRQRLSEIDAKLAEPTV